MTGERLQARRQRAGISLRTLATSLGISASYLCDLEWGRRKSASQLDRAANVLKAMAKAKRSAKP